MIYDLLLLLLGAMITSVLTDFFALFKTRYQVKLNPKFYNTKAIRFTLIIADKIEPHLLKVCGIISFVVGISIIIGGFILHKLFSACLLLPFFFISGCIFYTQVFPFKIVLKKKNGL